MPAEATMARPKRSSRTVTVRITEDAHRWAQVASGYTGEAAVDYVSRVNSERGKSDAIALHGEAIKEENPRCAKGD
jgi:hypothetical protein